MKKNQYNENLFPNLEKYLNRSDEDRIKFILKDKWIDYPHAQKVLKKLEDIFNTSPSIRPRGMLLYGDSNNGKTAILKRFYKLYGNMEEVDEYGDIKYTMPIVYAIASPSSDESRLYNDILTSMNVPIKHNEKVTKKEEELHYYLKLMETKMIIIDEIHSILSAPRNKMIHVMTALKTLNNRSGIPIILAGTDDAMDVISIDAQTESRFKPHELPQWHLDDDFANLVHTFEAMLPLKKASNIFYSYELLSYIHKESNSCIGNAINIMKDASIHAIRNKTEKITIKNIEESLF